MRLRDALKRAGREVASWLNALIDAVPPYRYVKAHLEMKVTDGDGRCYIRLGGAKVEVDRATFEALAIGEELWVRYTRRGKAVNIDRYSSEGES